MQAYSWDGAYDCIMLRWCSGYLADTELVSFLMEARAHLTKGRAYIIVLDNIAMGTGPIHPGKGQVIRTAHDFETIFK